MSNIEIENLPASPFELFGQWYQQAQQYQEMAETMTLATSNATGHPAARMVLLKKFDTSGFYFFTNYDSEKAAELKGNPYAALVFWSPKVKKQVRIQGLVQKTTAEISDRYFQTRARESQIGAWASPQSSVIPNRAFLNEAISKYAARFENEDVSRPSYWGGYQVVPDRMEFWIEGAARIHDRFLYVKERTLTWNISRLAP